MIPPCTSSTSAARRATTRRIYNSRQFRAAAPPPPLLCPIYPTLRLELLEIQILFLAGVRSGFTPRRYLKTNIRHFQFRILIRGTSLATHLATVIELPANTIPSPPTPPTACLYICYWRRVWLGVCLCDGMPTIERVVLDWDNLMLIHHHCAVHYIPQPNPRYSARRIFPGYYNRRNQEEVMQHIQSPILNHQAGQRD